MRTLLLVACSLLVYAQQPAMYGTNTPNGKRGDVVSISGKNLQKELVAKVILTDGEKDFPVEVVEQTSTMVRFKIPDKVPPGRMALMVLTTGKGGPQEYVGLLRFKFTIDQRGNFQVDDTYKRKAADRAQAVKWIKEQNDIVMGKGEWTLALIESVATWYKVDNTNPKAVSESGQLRDFYASFGEEYLKLLAMIEGNGDILSTEDISVLRQEATKESDEIDSKMRRLKAMGFQSRCGNLIAAVVL